MYLKALGFALLAVFLWATSFVGIRISLESYSPGVLAFLRYGLASLVLVPFYYRSKNKVPVRLSDLWRFAVIGATGFTLYNIALNHGGVTVTAGVSSFIIGLSPVFSVLFAFLLLKEPMPAGVVAGLIVSVVGLVVIAIGEHVSVHFDLGVLYLLCAALALALYCVIQKPLLTRYPPFQLVTLFIWFGAFFLLLFTHHLSSQVLHASWHATLSVVYLAVFPGILGYVCWSAALSFVRVAQLTPLHYLMPIFTLVLGYFILHEVPTTYSLLGGAICLSGGLLASLAATRRSK
jgi:drug/metabolite transporter (DMT)-like permease